MLSLTYNVYHRSHAKAQVPNYSGISYKLTAFSSHNMLWAQFFFPESQVRACVSDFSSHCGHCHPSPFLALDCLCPMSPANSSMRVNSLPRPDLEMDLEQSHCGLLILSLNLGSPGVVGGHVPPPNSYVEVLTPSTSQSDLIWK